MRRLGRAVLCAAALSVAAPVPDAFAAGDKQYFVLDGHDPTAFLQAARAGSDFVRGGSGRRFLIVLANAGVIIAIPGTSSIQRDVYKLLQGARGMTIQACKENLDLLAKANKRRIPTFPGVTVKSCKGVRKELATGGWEPAVGLK